MHNRNQVVKRLLCRPNLASTDMTSPASAGDDCLKVNALNGITGKPRAASEVLLPDNFSNLVRVVLAPFLGVLAPLFRVSFAVQKILRFIELPSFIGRHCLIPGVGVLVLVLLYWSGQVAPIIPIVHAQERAYTIAIGAIHPIEQEQQECVFPVGQGAAVLLHPKGEPCIRMRELIGRTGRLVFMVDDRP